jgi:periplasmic divalent cation tolerance protein
MQNQAILVLITVPDETTAQEIAGALISQRLAACVNVVSSIRSLYHWKGEIHDDQEVLLVVKTMADLFEDRLIPAVRLIHPYELPEIIALPILMGLQSYLEWINTETNP